MENCPTCNDKFDSNRSMSIHHKMAHGESIVKEEAICEIDECNNSFSYYPSNKDGNICPECINDGKNVIDSGALSIENICTPDNAVDYVDVKCKNCDKKDSVRPSRVSGDVYICCRKCLDEYNSDRMTGEDNPRYKDGESRGSNYDKNWRTTKRAALKRDGGRCCLCESEDNIHVHHLKPVRTFDEAKNAHFLSNTITLCASCHPKVEHGKINISKSIIEQKGLVEPEIIF